MEELIFFFFPSPQRVIARNITFRSMFMPMVSKRDRWERERFQKCEQPLFVIFYTLNQGIIIISSPINYPINNLIAQGWKYNF